MGLAKQSPGPDIGSGPGRARDLLNFASPSIDADNDQVKVGRNAGKVGKQWLRESYEGEATAQQGRAINKTMKGRRRRFKPSGRAGLEQVQDRIRTC